MGEWVLQPFEPKMSHAHYMLIQSNGVPVVGCFTEMLSNHTFVFEHLDELEQNLNFLEECFPTTSSRAWVAVGAAGEFFSCKDEPWLCDVSNHAEALYKRCQPSFPNVHTISKFLKHKRVRNVPEYARWRAADAAFLKLHGVTVNLPARDPPAETCDVVQKRARPSTDSEFV